MIVSSRARRLGAGAALAALLAGCATVGPNFRPPADPTTPGYAMTGDAAVGAGVRLGAPPSGPWWTEFGPPALDAVEQQALAGSPTIAEADAALAQAGASLAVARSQRLPEVAATAGAERERLNLASFGFSSFPGVSNNPTFSLYSLGATVSYNTDLFGGQRRQVEGAQARAESLARRGDAAVLALTGQVATAAVQTAGLKAEIAAVDAMIVDDQKTIDLVRTAQSLGADASSSQVSAQAQLAKDQALLPPLRQALAVARHQLALLVGKAPADWTPPEFQLSDFRVGQAPVALPSELVRRRPDILQAEADVHAATADIGVATAALYPNVTLSSSLTQSAVSVANIFQPTSTAYALAAQLTQPIFDGGRRQAQREAARAAARGALATYQQTVLIAFNQVADRMQALAHDDEATTAAQHTLQISLANLELARSAYRLGGAGLLPLIDAERQAGEARRNLVAAQTRAALDTVELIIASGAGWRSPT